MSLRTDLLPVVDELRGLAGPSGFDVRMSQLTIRTRIWAGGRRGLAPVTDTDLVLPQKYKVRSLKEAEISSSGGRFLAGDIRVGPITPEFTGGGYSSAQLAPGGADGTEILYVLTGATAGEYSLVELDTDKPFGYYLTLRRKRTTP